MKRQTKQECVAKKIDDSLFRHLEFSGLNYPAVALSQLVDINATVIIGEVNGSPGRNTLLFVHNFSKEIIHLHVVTLIAVFLQIKSDK